MTIDEVYRLVQTFANKEQRGFITPSEFNLLAKQAELELYNKRLSIVMEKSPLKKAAGYYAESLSPGLAEQDISSFLEITDLSLVDVSGPHFGAQVGIAADHIVQILTKAGEEHSISTNTPIEIVKPQNVNQILRSSLVKPTMEFPIALLSSYGDAKKIIVFPDSISNITVYYYLYQNVPQWDYVTIAGKPVYNSSGSSGFVISSRCHGEVVVKILEYLGVHLREAEVVQYASDKEIKQDS